MKLGHGTVSPDEGKKKSELPSPSHHPRLPIRPRSARRHPAFLVGRIDLANNFAITPLQSHPSEIRRSDLEVAARQALMGRPHVVLLEYFTAYFGDRDRPSKQAARRRRAECHHQRRMHNPTFEIVPPPAAPDLIGVRLLVQSSLAARLELIGPDILFSIAVAISAWAAAAGLDYEVATGGRAKPTQKPREPSELGAMFLSLAHEGRDATEDIR